MFKQNSASCLVTPLILNLQVTHRFYLTPFFLEYSLCRGVTQLGIRGGFQWIIINQQHCPKINLISPQMLNFQP